MSRADLKLVDVQKPQTLPNECCAKCHFVLKQEDQETSYTCRRFPPAVMFGLKPVQNLAGGVGLGWEHASSHPAVRAERWCGEFKPYAHMAIMQ